VQRVTVVRARQSGVLLLGTLVPGVATYAGLRVAGVSSAALPAAAAAGAGLGARTLAQLGFWRRGMTLSRGQAWFLVALQTAGLLVPLAVLLDRRVADPRARLALLSLAAVAIAAVARRGVARSEHDRLVTHLVGASSLRDADRLVGACRDLLPRYPSGPRHDVVALNLAAALGESTGLGDAQARLDEAVSVVMPLVERASGVREVRGAALRTLVDLLDLRYEVAGDLAGYAAAVDAAVEAAQEFPDLVGVRVGLAKLRVQFLSAVGEQQAEDLVAGRVGIDAVRASLLEGLAEVDRARRLLPRGDFELSGMRAGLLSQLAAVDDDRGVLEDAIAEARAAHRAAPRSPVSSRPMAAVMLAMVLLRGVEAGLGDELLEEADRVLRAASAEARDDQVRARVLRAQAEVGAWSLPGRAAGAGDQLGRYRQAFELLAASPFGALRMARAWGDRAAELGAAAEAATAFQHGLAAMRQLAALRLARRDRVKPLLDAEGMAAEAAWWLLELGRPADAALALEAGRAFVLTEVVQRERIGDQLRRHGHVELATRYVEITRRLADLELDEPVEADAGILTRLSPAARERVRRLGAVRAEWDQLADAIRALPGFSGFLAAPAYQDLMATARSRPTVYVAAADRGGFALVVTAGADAPGLVRLPELTRAAVSEWAARYREGLQALRDQREAGWRGRLDEVLDWLSGSVMEALTAELSWLSAVTLIPHGPLAMMPLHAAPVGGRRERALDRLLVAYAPNARVLAAAGASAATAGSGTRMLVVADPGEAGSRLVTVTPEIASIRRLFPDATVLDEGDARPGRVLQEVPRHTVLHFACHGHADQDDALASGLRLRDGDLSVRDLLAVRLTGAHLAVLSACETSLPHPKLFDEVVGLPGALLQAGLAGVVGSLWEVPERATLLLVSRFYELWRRHGVPAAEALNQAQRWLRDSTNAELQAYSQEFLAWPGRHTGRGLERWRSARDFAEPDSWAAFVYTGA
jgi:CHAT domain-containing protein